jgi:hypothetical protein
MITLHKANWHFWYGFCSSIIIIIIIIRQQGIWHHGNLTTSISLRGLDSASPNGLLSKVIEAVWTLLINQPHPRCSFASSFLVLALNTWLCDVLGVYKTYTALQVCVYVLVQAPTSIAIVVLLMLFLYLTFWLSVLAFQMSAEISWLPYRDSPIISWCYFWWQFIMSER